ncbi:hypothetical protein ABZS95_36835 [Streptomyces sp. NPDC005479]|uniref:hypothetical protein n=1 Tax=Streptomyces sp. NPDC005479 TaxID=3154879 RepID=UPI0033A6EB29
MAKVLHLEEFTIAAWGTGKAPNSGSCARLTGFLAVCEGISRLRSVTSVVTWFRTPLLLSSPYTPLDLADKGVGLETDYAAGLCTAEETLERMDKWWRDRTGM